MNNTYQKHYYIAPKNSHYDQSHWNYRKAAVIELISMSLRSQVIRGVNEANPPVISGTRGMPIQFFAKAQGIVSHLDFQQIELPEGSRYNFGHRETAAIALTGNVFGITF